MAMGGFHNKELRTRDVLQISELGSTLRGEVGLPQRFLGKACNLQPGWEVGFGNVFTPKMISISSLQPKTYGRKHPNL